MNDEEIVKEVLAGNVERYREIVEAYQQLVANLCYKLCGTCLDMEEVTQQVFVELYKALPRFQFKCKLATYIYRITVNIINKQLQQLKRQALPLDESAAQQPSEERNAEQEILHNEMIERLHQAIGMLKYEQRTALVLYTYNNFSYLDIADVMQCSLTKVETLIFRAKKNLKKLMEK